MFEISRICGWIKNVLSREERKTKREKLADSVRQIHEENRRSYGSPRILRVLHSEEVRCGKHRLEGNPWSKQIQKIDRGELIRVFSEQGLQ